MDIDKTGVPTPIQESSGKVYREKISDYFYGKISGIANDNDFTNSELTQYNLSKNSNNLIDISNTNKLLNYLKALIKNNFSKISSKLDTELEKKLNKTDYIVDNDLNEDSSNPVENNVLYDKFDTIEDSLNNKTDVGHQHNIEDINNLQDTLTDLNNQSDLKNKFRLVGSFNLGESSDAVGTIYANDYYVFIKVNGRIATIKPNESKAYTNRFIAEYNPLAPITFPATSTTNKIFIHIDGGNVYVVNFGDSTTVVCKSSVMYPRAIS